MMPKNAAEARAAQKATLAGVLYDKVHLRLLQDAASRAVKFSGAERVSTPR